MLFALIEQQENTCIMSKLDVQPQFSVPVKHADVINALFKFVVVEG